jgi:hypothetical protein
MASASDKLATARHFLAQRFPTLSVTTGTLDAPRPSRTLPTGIATVDGALGGLPLGAVTEIVCAAPSSGGHLLLAQLLTVTRATRTRVALIDGSDSFDPASVVPDSLAHLVWARCTTTATALGAADLLARDANLGLVILDLRQAAETDLRRISGPQWYRLQRAVESTDLALLVETPRASVPSAQVRFTLSTSHTMDACDIPRPTLATELAPTLSRQRLQIAAS